MFLHFHKFKSNDHFQCAGRAPGPTMAVRETAPITAGAGWSRPMAYRMGPWPEFYGLW